MVIQSNKILRQIEITAYTPSTKSWKQQQELWNTKFCIQVFNRQIVWIIPFKQRGLTLLKLKMRTQQLTDLLVSIVPQNDTVIDVARFQSIVPENDKFIVVAGFESVVPENDTVIDVAGCVSTFPTRSPKHVVGCTAHWTRPLLLQTLYRSDVTRHFSTWGLLFTPLED